MRKPALILDQDVVVVGEGQEEVAIINRMMVEGLVPRVIATHPGSLGNAGGISGFTSFLQALVGLSDFSRVRSVGLILDNDENPGEAFDQICQAVREANAKEDVNGRYSVPREPYVVATEGSIAASVYMSPRLALPGCLESLIWSALLATRPIESTCVDSLLACCNLTWPIQKIDKARVRALIATTYKRNPALALSWLWHEQPELVPVSDPAFSELVAFVRSL